MTFKTGRLLTRLCCDKAHRRGPVAGLAALRLDRLSQRDTDVHGSRAAGHPIDSTNQLHPKEEKEQTMISVKNKWALVTGASRGIGYLTSLFMAKRGCNLVLHSRSLDHTNTAVQEALALGVEAYAVQAELSSHEQVVAMLDEIQARGTAIDIVFNNAAVQVGYRQDYWKTPVEDFYTSFQINFIAVTTICYRLMPKMIERGFGRVINTTSGIRDQPEQAGYSASKAALDKFTIDLGSKLEGTNVLINLTDPGWCRTDLGGPQAPNPPESSLPGVAVGAFVDDGRCGRLLGASLFAGLSLKEAVKKAETL
jgi:short-subunit dehydrogenase